MINRIVLVGRVISAPQLSPAAGCLALTLEVDQPSSGPDSHRGSSASAASPDSRPPRVKVEVLIRQRRKGEILREYVDEGSHLMVEGHLLPADQSTRIELESFQFLPDNLCRVDFWEESRRSPSGASSRAA